MKGSWPLTHLYGYTRQRQDLKAANVRSFPRTGTRLNNSKPAENATVLNNNETLASCGENCDPLRIDICQLETANIESAAKLGEETKGSPSHSHHGPTATTDLESDSENVDVVPTDADHHETTQYPDDTLPFVSDFDFDVPLIPLGDFTPLFLAETPSSWLDYGASPSVTVTYSYYSFLVINNLHYMMPQDVTYLESQGCLEVPTNEILDDFVQQYFLHVHPLLPLLNEGDFWDAFYLRDAGVNHRVPLLVFQAMLFSSCPVSAVLKPFHILDRPNHDLSSLVKIQ